MNTASIKTSDGEFTARFSDRGLAQLDFPDRAPASDFRAQDLPPRMRAWLRTTERALRLTLSGRVARALPPLDLSGGTDFQRSVWDALRKIPAGKTRSYGEIAREIGRPRAVRAVGQACGANPIPVLIPCHRVLAARGRLGGFSADLAWKKRLLARELIGFKEETWLFPAFSNGR